MASTRWPLSQHWNRSLTHATSQPQATAERQKSRIYIPQNSEDPLFSYHLKQNQLICVDYSLDKINLQAIHMLPFV